MVLNPIGYNYLISALLSLSKKYNSTKFTMISMFEINANSRFLDLRGSIRLYYVIAAGIFISLFSYLLYRDILIVISMIVSSGVIYWLLATPPKKIRVKITDDFIIIDEVSIPFAVCKSFGVVNLDTVLEFVISTTKYDRPFYYFYIQNTESNLKMFMTIMAESIPFDADVTKIDKVHLILRELGLR